MVRSTRKHGVLSAEIGRRGQHAVEQACVRNGFPHCEVRQVKQRDRLDLLVDPVGRVIASVKAGEYAKQASLGDIAEWHHEADEKRQRDNMAMALLVVQRRGYGMDPDRTLHWRAWVIGHAGPLAILDHAEWQLANALRWLRQAGYGETP